MRNYHDCRTLLCGALGFAFILFAFSPRPAGAETLSLSGLKQPVEVIFDAEGTWHVFADNDFDAAFAQGYLHARDRFWEMDFNRRVASGTLAELVGMNALSQDIELRTIGLRRAALRSWRAYDVETRGILKAYAAGVNAWLANNPLPPEYGALELTEAERWSPVDSLVIAKALAFQLSFDLDIGRTINFMAYQQAGNIGGFSGAALFSEDTHRSQPIDDRVSIPDFFANTGILGKSGDTSASRVPLKSAARPYDPDTVAAAADYVGRIQDIPFLSRTMQPRENRGASNWWVVSGEHTESGHAILANDPHLSLNMPPVFAEGHIVVNRPGNRMNVSGSVVPGAPGVIIGCNTRLCWGVTTNPMDVTDTFSDPIVKNTLGFPTHTIHRGQREQLIWVFQSYFVNNPGDGETDSLTRAPVGLDSGGITFVSPRRNHGPILSIQGDTALTVQFTGFGPTQELKAFQIINRADGLDDFQRGLRFFDFGSQNFAYADVDGNIAYFTSAEMPLRRDLQRRSEPDGGIPPFFIRQGSNFWHQWMPQSNRPAHQANPYRMLRAAEMPHVINPDSGYIANANNDPVGTTLDNNPLNQLRPGGGLYYLNPGYSELRMGRIDRVLQDLLNRGDVTVADMEALQGNHALLDAELLTPFILAAFQNAQAEGAPPVLAQFAQSQEIAGAIQLLGQWDYTSPTGLTEGYGPDREAGTPPGPAEIANSAAATIYSTWRAQFLDNTLDGVFDGIGLGDFKPGSRLAFSAMAHQLMNFDETGGVGASGIPFFNVPEAGPATARDVIVLKSLADSLELLFSEEFAPAFGDATTLTDLRWGKLHRIVFDHPLGGPFNAPPAGGFTDLAPDLPGIPRSGGYQAVDASSHSARADGLNDFMFGSGPSRRFIGVLDPAGIEAQEILPGGQSGVLVSPFYTNQLERWLNNEYHPLIIDSGEARGAEMDRLDLQPAG